MLGYLWYLDAVNQRHMINQIPASDPAGLALSDEKLRQLCPTMYCSSGLRGFVRCFLLDGWQYRHLIRDMLIHGDSRAAVVMSTSPLLVACYSDDADGVCLL